MIMSEHLSKLRLAISPKGYLRSHLYLVDGGSHFAVCERNKDVTEVMRRWNSFDDLLEACKAWDKYDSESSDKHPCPDLTLRIHYRKLARELTEIALTKAEKKQ